MQKKLIIFDMDGTIYLGKDLFEGALETFKYLKDNNILFSGDSLFKGSVGRYDLPTSNPSLMRESVNIILSLPKETIVYPGHGEETSVKDAF